MKFYLMGGETPGKTKLYEIMLKITGKDNPKILYFPNASVDYQNSFERFKKQTDGFNCYIELFSNQDVSFNDYDILYFGGGITQKIVFELRSLKDLIIKSNCLLAGSSAGANMWFLAGVGDFYSYYDNFHTYNYKLIKGFGAINATFCPHYQKEDLIVYNDMVKEYEADGFALENDTALFLNDSYFEIFKQNNASSAYWFKRTENYKMIPLYEGIKYKIKED